MSYHDRLSELENKLDALLEEIRNCPDDDHKREQALNARLKRLLGQHQAVLDEIEILAAEE